MPIESETDRAVADILGRYITECRANREASEKEKGGEKCKSKTNVQRMELGINEKIEPPSAATLQESTLSFEEQPTQKDNDHGPISNTGNSFMSKDFIYKN